MFLLDRMLVGGIRFVLDKVARAVEEELNDDSHLREELLAAQMKVELGEMTQAEFEELEVAVLARIREIHDARTGGQRGPIGFEAGATVDADFVADDFHDEPGR